jgi:hypothetical protein
VPPSGLDAEHLAGVADGQSTDPTGGGPGDDGFGGFVLGLADAPPVPRLMAANAAYTGAVVVASLVNRTQRQRIVPRAMLGRVTSGSGCFSWPWTRSGGARRHGDVGAGR